MLARIQAARKNESGFTLVELLIVIVILGVLSGIVVFSVSGITNNSAKAACKTDVNIVEIASEAYYAQNGTYATAIDDLTHTATTLVGAKLIKAPPAASEGIALTSGTGVVTHTCSF